MKGMQVSMGVREHVTASLQCWSHFRLGVELGFLLARQTKFQAFVVTVCDLETSTTPCLKLYSAVYEFPVAAVTNYCKLNGQNQMS
jgi:hypothetical protein